LIHSRVGKTRVSTLVQTDELLLSPEENPLVKQLLAWFGTGRVEAPDPDPVTKNFVVANPLPSDKIPTAFEISGSADGVHLRKKREDTQGFYDGDLVAFWKLFEDLPNAFRPVDFKHQRLRARPE
jgi:hypothetical protein